MAVWSFLDRPASVRDEAGFRAWFADVARRLLNGTRLVAGGQPHRLTEIEFYYKSADHPDPFPHADPIQYEKGLWYFHKSRGAYRTASFKGVDLTFGHPGATGGILVRGIEKPDGTLIDGPSLTVDYLLGLTGFADVPALDAAIAGRRAWQAGNPLGLIALPGPERRTVYRSARVGLSLRRAWLREGPRYVMSPYRFLTEAARVRKGKALLILALHDEGATEEEIQAITGSPLRSIRAAVEQSREAGRDPDFQDFLGKDLTPKALCRLHGTWQAIYGHDTGPKRKRS